MTHEDLFRDTREPRPLTPEEITGKIDEARRQREPGILLSMLVRAIETESIPTPDVMTAIETLGSLIATENRAYLEMLPVLEAEEARTELPAVIDMVGIGERLVALGKDKDIKNWGQAIREIEALKREYTEEIQRRLKRLRTTS